ncbi:acyl-CoA N-acyltransferase [Aureobasidium pullulans]|uniref:Acyl-CoA N-acyltransferase n=1 Tax=Aureobasidium pullulans TaxID=5580 RepID=A0AB38MAG6_AURPU|nr:acyl-CoA N-acyltransferase [Aureobasidium pullulans]THZ42027.1 acyl-CoA N-acyltransferase [Aureobasidium pullulans]THZ78632.1 acyl-CoA N-acyltransferase [Aureobasidium pullulans]
MPILVRPMRPSDLPARERIMAAAFSAGLRPHIYPNGTTPADTIHMFTDTLSSMQSKTSLSDDQPGSRLFVAYDSEVPALPSDLEFPETWEKKTEVELTGKAKEEEKRIVGLALWQLQPFARKQEDVDKEKESADGDSSHAPSANAALLDGFAEALTAARDRWIGLEAYLYLKVLAIDPAYQRKGVGSLLLDEGLSIADRIGLQAYLEATEVGRPLYKRKGFEDRDYMDFDVAKYAPAAEGEDHRFMCMVRPAPAGGKKTVGGIKGANEEQGGNEVVVEKAE